MNDPRRWFRFAFSLRTLFVSVTLVGGWLGYQLHWIGQRVACLDRNGTDFYIWYVNGEGASDFSGLSTWRNWLGDLQIDAITVFHAEQHPASVRMRWLFPESAIGYSPGGLGPIIEASIRRSAPTDPAP